MARINVNGVDVSLVGQPRDQYARLGAAVISRFSEGVELPALICAAYAEGMKMNAANDNPFCQACLWCLHEMGIRTFTINLETSTAEVLEGVGASDRSSQVGDPYSMGNFATGRAMITALANFQKRQFRFNGEEIPVRLQPQEMLAQAMRAVTHERRVNEPIHSATARMYGSLLKSGAPRDDPKCLAVMQLLSDLGVRGVRIDVDKGQLMFEELSESDAQASAYLQGMDTAGIHAARDRIRAIAAHINKLAAQAAAQQASRQAAEWTAGAVATNAPKTSFVRATIKRRRRD